MNEIIDKLKIILRESAMPFFSDEELEFYYEQNGNDFNSAVYELCNVKAQNTALIMSGLTTPETKDYFLGIANMYQPFNSGILGE